MISPDHPKVLQHAVACLPYLLDQLAYSRPAALRHMRPERHNALLSLLEVMLCRCSLRHDGGIFTLNGDWFRPPTRKELAKASGLSLASVKRCFRDLDKLGLLQSRQIKRRNKINGNFEASPSIRAFTPKFWELLGLSELFKESCAWAKKNCNRRLVLPFRTIIRKAKAAAEAACEKVVSAGQVLAGSLLPKMQESDADRVKRKAGEILAMIRQRK